MINFPCVFPIKIIFKNEPGVDASLRAILLRHHPELTHDDIQQQPSQNGRYLSITATLNATDQASLDTLYCELKQHAHVQMVL